MAAENGQDNVVKLLLTAGVEVNKIEKVSDFYIWQCCHLVNTVVFKFDLFYCCPQGGQSALHGAAKNSHKTVVELLLSSGADSDIADEVRFILASCCDLSNFTEFL